MRSFSEYSATVKFNFNPEVLDLCVQDQEYCICEGAGPLLTPGGHVFSHASENLMRLLLTDMQLFQGSAPDHISSPVLYSFCRDVLISEGDPLPVQWESLLRTDPFVQVKTSGKLVNQAVNPEDPLFAFTYITLTGLTGMVNRFTARHMSDVILDEGEIHPFPELLWLFYNHLTNGLKVAVQALGSIHRAGIVLPLLLVSGEISPVEYAKGLIALKIRPAADYSEILTRVAGIQAYLGCLIQNPDHEIPMTALIREGEGASIEFKSTLRYDIRAGKNNPAIERACLKTITAFLNSKGGCLLIGIRDDGSAEGIETDKFANDDKFLLHLWTLIRTCLGSSFSTLIQTRLGKYEEKTICVVNCHPATRPAFLRQPGFDEEMYIRVGPSNNALDISEAIKYIECHFK